MGCLKHHDSNFHLWTKAGGRARARAPHARNKTVRYDRALAWHPLELNSRSPWGSILEFPFKRRPFSMAPPKSPNPNVQNQESKISNSKISVLDFKHKNKNESESQNRKISKSMNVNLEDASMERWDQSSSSKWIPNMFNRKSTPLVPIHGNICNFL